MGGNAFTREFPGANRRFDRADYLAIEEFLCDGKFSALFHKFEVCPYLDSKESFGDMDVICIPYAPLSVERLKDWFQTEYVLHNGSTYSLIYKELQIDLIVSNYDEYNFHRNYLGLFDRGNYIGKLAHMLGLKFGHDGLWLPIRFNDSHKLADVLLTRDPREAEDFLDVKPLVNATKIEDVFNNVIASKYFNPEIFQLENNNQIARVRDKKRPSYRAFLEYIKTLSDHYCFPRLEDKLQYLPMIFEAFPKAEQKYKDLYAYKNLVDSNRIKFNGNLVSEWTKKTGKELGDFMVELKKFLTHEKISKMSAQDIKLFVLTINS